jgi:hypothetical protein
VPDASRKPVGYLKMRIFETQTFDLRVFLTFNPIIGAVFFTNCQKKELDLEIHLNLLGKNPL